MIGKTIGKYRIVEKLGRGGMGTVYKAVDETLDREVAVKVLNPELTDSDVMKRFRAEATTLAKLNHPDIATIHEIFRSETDLLMVMELVRGETLDQLAQRCGPLPPERAAYLVAQVLGALEHAHRAGIVHRDLKPANIMVAEHGGVKVMDFGIARVAGAEHLTNDGHMMGTPAYMAPEQVVAKEVDGRADLYSAGVVFYRLLTGNLPFQADTAIGMVQKQLSEAPTPVHVHRSDLPDWCETLLVRALAKSPADRFQTAEEFRAALLSAMGSAATEHTGAYAAARLDPATPLPTPVAAVTNTTAPSGPRTTNMAARPPAAPKNMAPADGATIVLQKNHFAMAGGLLAIVAVGVAVLAFVALRRQPSAAQPAPVAAVGPSLASTTAAARPTDTPPGSPAPAEPAAPAASPPATPPSPSSAATQPATAPSASPARRETQAPAPVEKRPAVALTSSAPKPPSGEPARAKRETNAPPFVFDAKAVVTDGGKNREHDTKVLLADGKVTVTERNDKIVTTLPYGAVVGVSYSNSKQPLWNSPQGPAEMMKVEGGAFGFLKGGRNWLGLRTHDTSLVLRVNDDDLRRVIAAIEERTGRKVERVVERKD